MNIQDTIHTIQNSRVRISNHADEEAASDHLIYAEISFSVTYGEMIEFYPEDHPYPSCLIFGHTPEGDPIHSVWVYNLEN